MQVVEGVEVDMRGMEWFMENPQGILASLTPMYSSKTINKNKVRSEGIAMAQLRPRYFVPYVFVSYLFSLRLSHLLMLGIVHVRSVHVRQSTASCMHIHRGHTSCMTRSMTSRDGRDVADQARYMLQGQEISADTD